MLALLSVLAVRSALAQPTWRNIKLLDRIAQTDYHPTFSAVTANLILGENRPRAYAQLDTLLSREYGDMFWMYGCAGLYFSCRDVLPVSYKVKIRQCWKLFTPYRGDTENHFLMYYGSLLLMSEEWDSLPASEWFMGRSSVEIHAEARQWLLHWIEETAKQGMSEFDSPRYLYYYITPLILLSEYARDAEVKHQSEMMLEYLLANYAVKYQEGSYVGAHSRESNEAALVPAIAEVLSYGEFFFEDSVKHLLPDLAFAAACNYRIPSVIREMAHDDGGFECREIVRSRRRIRFETPAVKPVRKYTYVNRHYALGSIESGIIQPIQQRSWSLTLRSHERYNTIAGLHPYHSTKELGTFFPEPASFGMEKIEGVKNGYTSEDKWVGASPYEKIWQRKNQLRLTYDVPKDYPVKHADLFIPAWGDLVSADSTVWHELIVRYDSVLVTINTSNDYTITDAPGGYRLRMDLPKGKGGFWIYVSDSPNDGGIDARMFSGKGEYDTDDRKWLIDSPSLRSVYGSGIITMKNGESERVLDFVQGKSYDK